MLHIIASRATGAFEYDDTNYSGHRFGEFFVRQDAAHGPGWYVFGRNAEKYGRKPDGAGAYVMLCARPNVKARAHRHYNGMVRRGWHTKREAQAVAAYLNTREG